MRIAFQNRLLWSLGGLLASALCLVQAGCITYAAHAIPASRLPDIYQAETRCDKVPVNFTLLRQEPPREYLLGEGDMIGVYVPTVIPPVVPGVPGAPGGQIVPIVPPVGGNLTRIQYPPGGLMNAPNVGVPLTIGTGGVLSLPRLAPQNLTGLTLTQAAEQIRAGYQDIGIIPEGQSVSITLLKPRTHRVVVLREDTASSIATLINIAQVPYTRRGQGEVIDLPAYENDVLHVLAVTGGLPGIEAFSHVWVLKSATGPGVAEEARARLDAGEDAAQVFRALNAQRTAIRIPLRVCAGEPLPFGPQDIILHTGDVVYLEPRDVEVFYTGGILPGREVPLPRDRDIDILEAVAIASGSVGGYGSGPNSATFRNNAVAGNIIPPTRATIVRKLPNGQQILIRADLAKALHDPRERVIIQPGDFVMMNYKPGEVAGNVALNLVGFNVTWLVGQ
jgi:protein involved in polysaccharide export with SLBB domain